MTPTVDVELDRAHPPTSGNGRTGGGPSLVPWLVLLFLGSAALGAWFLIGPTLGVGRYYRPGFTRGAYSYGRQLLLLFVPFALALWAWHRGARAPVRVLFAGAVALHVLVLFAPLPQSQDFYQYLFYGRMQAVYGANPFVVDPSEFRYDPWYVWIRWYGQPSVYGPVWTLLSAAVARMAGDSLSVAFASLKLIILALDVAVMALILRVARGPDRDPDAGAWGLLVYGWNPLVLISVPLAGAADVALAAGVLAAILTRRQGRIAVATVLLTLIALIKAYAAIAIVLHLVLVARTGGRRALMRHAAGAAALVLVAFAPYWEGPATFSGLYEAAGLHNLSLAGVTGRLLSAAAEAVGLPGGVIAAIAIRVVGGGLLLWAVVRAARMVRDEASLWYGVVFVLAAYVLLTPWFMYWYTISALALVAALPRTDLTYPVLVFTGTAMIRLNLRPRLLGWALEGMARYAPPLLLYVRHRRRGAASSPGRPPFRQPAAAPGKLEARAPAPD